MIRAAGARQVAAALGALAFAGCATSFLSESGVQPAAYERLVARTVAVRGLPLREAVPARVIDQANVPLVLRATLEAGLSKGEVAAYQDALVAIGLWPDGPSLVDEYLTVAKEEVVGFYVPQDRVLYIVRDANIPFWARVLSFFVRHDAVREIVLGHELIHALQHQNHPDLVEHDRFLKDQDDLGSALEATIEGDATFFSLAVPDPPIPPSDPTEFREELQRDTAGRAEGALAGAPALLREGLYFPYAWGYALSYREHGALLDDPPISTEQVLHPERRHEPFVALDLGAGRNLLPAGCAFVHENGVGEFGLSVLLKDLAPREMPPDPTAWEGWNGDRYLVARCNGRREFLWLTLWDSEQDASEFEAAYWNVTGSLCARAGYPVPPALTRRGSEVLIVTPGIASAADAIVSQARRGQVSTLREVLEFYGEPILDAAGTPAP
ncbi:MAG TPA: hypothetical protein VKM54_29080 [Myxococcota bacterium]|nr:hypothetical protein [Myxococcota bacterium]